MATTLPVIRSQTSGRHWLLVGLLLFFAAVSARYCLKVYKVESPESADRSAIQRWMPQLRDYVAGENIWQKHNFPCPPIMALILAPLTFMPPAVAAMSWFAVKAAMTIALVF